MQLGRSEGRRRARNLLVSLLARLFASEPGWTVFLGSGWEKAGRASDRVRQLIFSYSLSVIFFALVFFSPSFKV